MHFQPPQVILMQGVQEPHNEKQMCKSSLIVPQLGLVRLFIFCERYYPQIARAMLMIMERTKYRAIWVLHLSEQLVF